MPRVVLTRAAAEDLDRLVLTHSLPSDTRRRLANSLAGLGAFPLLGPALSGRWSGFRFALGPWRWMICVYVYDEDTDTVVVVTVQDGRSSIAATGVE